MKKYIKLIQSIRIYSPIIIGILVSFTGNLIEGLILVLIWIFIDQVFIEPKFPIRNKRKEGEVFIIQASKNTFFFGKVIRKQIPINDPIMDGGHLVYIFNQTVNSMVIPEYLDPKNLIIPPQIINNQGWTKGYFQTVGIQRVTNEERELNYGFWDVVTKKFVNEEGRELNKIPNIYCDFGLASYGSISDELRTSLNSSYKV